LVRYVSTANVIINLPIVKVITIIYGNQEAKVKDTSIIYTAEVVWFEPVVNELGEGHEKDDTKNFERHMIKLVI
jgi:hypothetical protein